MPRAALSSRLEELIVAANFVEVALAKEGHSNAVGINYLEKIHVTMLPSLYGAMLAGVDYVLIGAGIPRAIPKVLDHLANGEPVELKIDLKGGGTDDGLFSRFDPVAFTGEALPPLRRPMFLAIVSSHVLATMLAQRVEPPVDGFVIEGPTAGGHNAPPRGKLGLNPAGEPITGIGTLRTSTPSVDSVSRSGSPGRTLSRSVFVPRWPNRPQVCRSGPRSPTAKSRGSTPTTTSTEDRRGSAPRDPLEFRPSRHGGVVAHERRTSNSPSPVDETSHQEDEPRLS